MTWQKASSSWRVFGCQEGVKQSSFFLFQFRCQRRCQKIIIIIIIIIIITGAQWSHNHWCLRRHSRQGTIIKQSSNSWLKACSPRISHSWNSLSKQIFAQKMQQKMKEEKKLNKQAFQFQGRHSSGSWQNSCNTWKLPGHAMTHEGGRSG